MPRSLAALLFLPLYFLITIAIGWWAGRRTGSANAYLNATRSLPLWIIAAAYLAANCGALEIVGLSAMAAQYGVQAFHFYWIGAIPGMIFLSLWMMPVYRRSGVHSVPEYLAVRYGPSLRLLNACVLALTMLLLAGISLYAMGQVLEVVMGLGFQLSVAVSAAVVLVYVLLGGVRATIYNEVFQLAVLLAGLIPLALRSLHAGARAEVPAMHLWTTLPAASQHAPLDGVGVVIGLGFVLSFGYWSTDFVQMQRAFAARTETAARQVPLWAGFGKLGFSLLVVLPALAAHRLLPQLGVTQRFDQTLPMLMTRLYGPTLLGIGLTAIAASLTSSLASNVSAFAAIVTQDIYRARLNPHASERHYLHAGRLAAAAAILLALFASFLNFFFWNLMEHVQLLFSIFGAPFFAIFLLGMATTRTTERGAITGFLTGTAVALFHLFATTQGWLHYGSIMTANFHAAIYAFSAALLTAYATSSPDRKHAPTLVFHWRTGVDAPRSLWLLAILLLTACAALNYIWR